MAKDNQEKQTVARNSISISISALPLLDVLFVMISTCVSGVRKHKFYPMLVLEVHSYVEYLSCMVELQSADLTMHLVAVWMPVH